MIDRAISPDPQADALVGLRVDQVDPRFLERLRSERVLRLQLPQDLPLSGFPFAGGMRSSAVIALPSENSLLGAFSLSSRAENAFDDVDTDLLERVGTQLSLAIKNARLYDDIKRMHLSNLKALSSALNAKDYYTLGHAARVAAYTRHARPPSSAGSPSCSSHARGGRLPARHRQDRHLRPRAAQAGQAQRRRSGS